MQLECAMCGGRQRKGTHMLGLPTLRVLLRMQIFGTQEARAHWDQKFVNPGDRLRKGTGCPVHDRRLVPLAAEVWEQSQGGGASSGQPAITRLKNIYPDKVLLCMDQRMDEDDRLKLLVLNEAAKFAGNHGWTSLRPIVAKMMAQPVGEGLCHVCGVGEAM